jgi:hypothetical protein
VPGDRGSGRRLANLWRFTGAPRTFFENPRVGGSIPTQATKKTNDLAQPPSRHQQRPVEPRAEAAPPYPVSTWRQHCKAPTTDGVGSTWGASPAAAGASCDSDSGPSPKSSVLPCSASWHVRHRPTKLDGWCTPRRVANGSECMCASAAGSRCSDGSQSGRSAMSSSRCARRSHSTPRLSGLVRWTRHRLQRCRPVSRLVRGAAATAACAALA